MIWLCALGYLSGYLLCYFIARTIVREKRGGDWVVMEKIITAVLSLLSWVAIVGTLLLITMSIFAKIDLDKETKW
jgi:biotin transporter BioY